MSDTMKRVVLKTYCEGLPTPQDFDIEEKPLPEPDDGQFLVRHIWNSVDPGTRSRLSSGDSYAAALKLGQPIDGFNVGEVIVSRNDKYKTGDLVFMAGGWRTHSIQNGKGFIGHLPTRDLPLSYWIGVLGVPGLTAWFGMHRVAELKDNENVLITSAAGPVGATAGQLAKARGCRVVGVAGGPTKCAWLKDEAGFDEVIDYKSVPDLTKALAEALPKGVDVLFDNVGNEMIDRVMGMMRLNGRIVVSGQVADYNLPVSERYGIRNTAPFITHRVRMEGLVVFDDAPAFPEALGAMAGMIAGGKLKIKEDRFEGIESMPEAFCGLFKGENFGRRVIQVGEEPI